MSAGCIIHHPFSGNLFTRIHFWKLIFWENFTWNDFTAYQKNTMGNSVSCEMWHRYSLQNCSCLLAVYLRRPCGDTLSRKWSCSLVGLRNWKPHTLTRWYSQRSALLVDLLSLEENTTLWKSFLHIILQKQIFVGFKFHWPLTKTLWIKGVLVVDLLSKI